MSLVDTNFTTLVGLGFDWYHIATRVARNGYLGLTLEIAYYLHQVMLSTKLDTDSDSHCCTAVSALEPAAKLKHYSC